MNTSMLRVAAVTAALLGLSMPALADFSGYYAPSNWTIGHLPDAPTDQGTVDPTMAPVSITLNGSDTSPLAPSNFSRLNFTITAPAAGQVSFDWSYLSNDSGPGFDPAGHLLNGATTQLTVDSGAFAQSGQLSFNVTAGQAFGFYVLSNDNFGGNAVLTISNFTAPIPEPASVAMMSLGLLGIAGVAARRRRSK